MARKDINSSWDRDSRNAMNDNFIELYKEYIAAGMNAAEARQKALEAVNESNKAKQLANQAKDNSEAALQYTVGKYLEPVDTFTDIATTYPNAVENDRVFVRDTGKVYILQNNKWQEFSEITSGPVDEVDKRLSAQLAETMQELTVISEATVHVENFPRFTNELTDSPRINRAIEYAITNGIRNVELPDKTLLISSPLIVDGNNIKIYGGHNTILRRADGYTADVIRSVQDERSRITGSLENVIFEQFTIDGVDNTATGITLTRFTRGCVIRGVQIKNCRDGIDIDDSWSFSLIGNVLNVFSGDGIKFNTGNKEVNALIMQGNTVRNAGGYGLYAPNLHAVDVTGNTFELNGINVLLGGQGGNFRGNYCEKPTSNNVILGTPLQALEGFEVGG